MFSFPKCQQQILVPDAGVTSPLAGAGVWGLVCALGENASAVRGDLA